MQNELKACPFERGQVWKNPDDEIMMILRVCPYRHKIEYITQDGERGSFYASDKSITDNATLVTAQAPDPSVSGEVVEAFKLCPVCESDAYNRGFKDAYDHCKIMGDAATREDAVPAVSSIGDIDAVNSVRTSPTPQAAVEREWQPIANCPKEKGVPIIMHDIEGVTDIGWWSGEFKNRDGYIFEATHWMPLPLPPQADTNEPVADREG